VKRAALLLVWRAGSLARVVAGALLAYAAGAAVALGWGLPQIVLSPAGATLGGGLGALLLVSAAAPLLDQGARPLSRVARALARGGLALVLVGVPLSLFARETHTFLAGEGQDAVTDVAPGLPPLRVDRVDVAPRADGLLLSRSVTAEATLADGRRVRVPLWPPARVGAWRLAVLRFGLAPGLEWLDPAGEPIAAGFVPLGTLPRSTAEEALVTWLPEPALMLGVGYYPPKLEDLLPADGGRRHLFVRIVSAELGGVRRDLTDPSAHAWLADGRPERAELLVRELVGTRATFEGHVRAGDTARLPSGTLFVAPETRLWVEIQAVWDPWALLAAAGLAALAAAAVLGGVLRVAIRSRPSWPSSPPRA
jgi:hypothetical protein